MDCRRCVRRNWLSPLLNWTVTVEGRALTRSLGHRAVAALRWCAKLSLWALDTMQRSLPICRTLWLLDESLIRSRGRGWSRFHLNPGSWTDRVDGRPRRRRHANAIRVILKATLNPVPGGQECIKSLNQVWMASEELGDAANHARRIDAVADQQTRTPTPGYCYNSRLALEILHYIKEPIVNVRLLRELDLDLV